METARLYMPHLVAANFIQMMLMKKHENLAGKYYQLTQNTF